MEINNRPQLSIICFGGLDWWYHPRSHADIQMIKRFPKYGPTLYINSIVMQKLKLKGNVKFSTRLTRKLKSIFTGLKKVDNNFWVYSPLSFPAHHISWLKKINDLLLIIQVRIVSKRIGIKDPLIWAVIPVVYNVAMSLKKKNKLVYHKLDKYEVFPNVDFQIVKRLDDMLQKDADLTIFISKELYNERSDKCKNPLYLDHGVDFDLFAAAEKSDIIPHDILNIKRPVVGFFGSINIHTVDIDFLSKVADKLPDVSFVFVGRCSSNYKKLTGKKNVYMLNFKPYEEIPLYGKVFDVAIMAWQNTEWIKMCNPIKLKEYLALGKPIVSTPFPELENYKDVVYIAGSPEKFSSGIKKALKENSIDFIKKRRKKVQKETWDNKVKIILNKIGYLESIS